MKKSISLILFPFLLIVNHLQDGLPYGFQRLSVDIVHVVFLGVPVGSESCFRVGVVVDDVDRGNASATDHILMIIGDGSTIRIDKKLAIP